jgi:3-deoxy-manno-octulosonate cytidylyltransferase (CMP-KDO synthetase)
MLNLQKVVCIIPVRLSSTRFPEKILSTLLKKPLLKWVWEAATRVSFFDKIIFAVDSEITAKLTTSFSANHIMTSQKCLSGTDRLIEIMKTNEIQSDIWVNWQGDEPFITENMINTLLQNCGNKNTDDVWTLKKKIEYPEELISPHVVKIVSGRQNQVLYFSRNQIPFYCSNTPKNKRKYYKHIGIYAYTTKALQKISNISSSPLEQAEKLEQLRWLENGLSIKAHETSENTLGIDVPEDIKRAEKWIQEKDAKTEKFF